MLKPLYLSLLGPAVEQYKKSLNEIVFKFSSKIYIGSIYIRYAHLLKVSKEPN